MCALVVVTEIIFSILMMRMEVYEDKMGRDGAHTHTHTATQTEKGHRSEESEDGTCGHTN